MTTVFLSLATAAFFGGADYLGGLASRRESAFAVTATVHIVALPILAAAAWLFPWEHVSVPDLMWGAAAGVSGGIGVLSLFAALAAGKMSIVAPTTAALSGSLPALYDFASGNVPGLVDIVGLSMALFAVVLVSTAEDDGEFAMPARATVLAVVAGFGFAGSFLLLSLTSTSSGMWPLVSSRLMSLAMLVLLAAVRLRGWPFARSVKRMALITGVLDSSANITMLSAIRTGPLAVASVLGSMYPVVTVLLALTLLKEQLVARQKTGVMIAFAAVVLTALG